MKSMVCSISLNVKDIAKTRDFYEKKGFQVFFGDISQYWLLMKKGDFIIGLFQRMMETKAPSSLYA